MNGIDAVVLATGNDWRAVSWRGARKHAAREGRYTSLSSWRRDGQGHLIGELALPLALGTIKVKIATHVTHGPEVALKILGVQEACALAEIVVSVGLAQNLATLHALAPKAPTRTWAHAHARWRWLPARRRRDQRHRRCDDCENATSRSTPPSSSGDGEDNDRRMCAWRSSDEATARKWGSRATATSYVPSLPSTEVARVWSGGGRGRSAEKRSPALMKATVTIAIEATQRGCARRNRAEYPARDLDQQRSRLYAVKPASTLKAEGAWGRPPPPAGGRTLGALAGQRRRRPRPGAGRAEQAVTCPSHRRGHGAGTTRRRVEYTA